MQDDELYSDFLLKQLKNPQHAGRLEDAKLNFKAKNSLCGDIISIGVKFDAAEKAVIKFEASGCAVSRAAAGVVTDMANQLTLNQILEIDPKKVLEYFGNHIQLRQKCALLPLLTLQQGLVVFQKNGTTSLNLEI